MTHAKIPTPLRLTLAALALTFAFAACGDDDDTSAESDDAAATAPADEGEDAGAAPAGGEAVAIIDFAYEPAELTVAPGTSVTFTNEDDSAHTVESDDDAPAEFDSENLEQGDTFEQTFDEAGEYPYFCGIHNYMKGTVIVE
ncbi:hypothetical protein BH20ACT2_BH20ACT2_17430 [soil metagenome]